MATYLNTLKTLKTNENLNISCFVFYYTAAPKIKLADKVLF